MVVGILDRAAPSLVDHLFRDAHLLTWLAEAPVDVAPQSREFDSPSINPTRRPLRAGDTRWFNTRSRHTNTSFNHVVESFKKLAVIGRSQQDTVMPSIQYSLIK